jgi:hypothetical protein
MFSYLLTAYGIAACKCGQKDEYMLSYNHLIFNDVFKRWIVSSSIVVQMDHVAD